MDDLEQSELLREWLKANGAAIVTGVALGLGGLLGWQWWTHSVSQHRLDAATTFQSLQDAADADDSARTEQFAAELGDKFGKTPYATLALLRLADEKIAQGDTEASMKALTDALDKAQSPSLAALVRLRLARVQLASGQAQESLDNLAKIPSDDYAGLVAETRGDALLALGRSDEAIAAYRDAMTSLETGAPNRSIVEMKLADMGEADSEPGA